MENINANTGWLFYKNYYLETETGSKIDFLQDKTNKRNEELFIARNRELLKQTIVKDDALADIKDHLSLQNFQLETIYPGLLLGSGYNHGTGKQGELKLGFFFDHTSGMPCIPGSSVKGLLRSMFPGMDYERYVKATLKGDKNVDIYKDHYEEKLAFIEALLGSLKIDLKGLDNILKMEWEVFAGISNYRIKKEDDQVKKSGEMIPMSSRDVFIDAPVVGPVGKPFLGDDYITPHKNEFKNPIPIYFLKVLPKTVFEFRFDLKEKYTLKGENKTRILTAKQRRDLFKEILLIKGAGAKTNVGYGQFVEKENN